MSGSDTPVKKPVNALRQAQGDEQKGAVHSGTGSVRAEPVEAWGGVLQQAAKARSARRPRLIAPIPLLLLVLFDVGFNLYFWRIPKLTGRAADYGYQVLLDVHRLEQPKLPGVARVLAFGSSVAGSLDEYQVESLLNATDHSATRVEMHRLLKPGMKPSDYRILFASELEAMHPDLVIVMLNFQDFLNASFERDLKPDVQYVLPPWTTLRDRWAFISTVSGKLDLALASVSNLYRYRRAIRSCVQDHLRFLAKWLRSRSPKRAYGRYPDRYTRQRFGLLMKPETTELEYFVHPEWIQQRGQVRLQFSLGARVFAGRVEIEPGWKAIEVPATAGSARLLEVAADSAWSPRAAGMPDDFRLLGVQLRDGSSENAVDNGLLPLRYPPVDQHEISEFLRLGQTRGEAFVRRWDAELAAPTEFGTRLRAWRDSKLKVRDDRFEPTGEFIELDRLVAEFSRRGISVALVNTPESPLTADYQNGSYYRGYLQFFEQLARTYPRVRFYNLLNSLPAEEFNDIVHANYVGGIKLGPIYADIVRDALRR